MFLPMHPENSTSEFVARQERLRALMEARRIPLLLISNLVNTRYLTGFTGSAGMALVGHARGSFGLTPVIRSRRASKSTVWRSLRISGARFEG